MAGVGRIMVDAATLSLHPKWLNDDDSQMVGLWVENTGTGAAVWSSSVTGASYSVPAGRKLEILNISHRIVETGGGVNVIDLYAASTPTGTDHIKAVFASSGHGSDSGADFQVIPVYIVIEAGDYVTQTASTSAGYYGQIVGVETTV